MESPWSSAIRRLGEGYRERRYALLFYSLILSLALVPLLNAIGHQTRWIEVVLAINVLAAAIAAHHGPVRKAVLVFLLVSVGGRIAAAWFGSEFYAMAILGVWTLIAIVAAGQALYGALRAQVVAHEHVYAVLSAYLLAGIFFGVFYSVIEHYAPGSVVSNNPADAGLPVSQGIYFSFVTLASLGYGDIVPVSGLARGLAVIETIGGQLYLAALVARLVSVSR